MGGAQTQYNLARPVIGRAYRVRGRCTLPGVSTSFETARAGANQVALAVAACLLGVVAGAAGGFWQFRGSDGAGAFFALIFGAAAGLAAGLACGVAGVLLARSGRSGAGWAASAVGASVLGAAAGALAVLAI